MNLYHVHAVAETLYRLKFDVDESRRKAYRVTDVVGYIAEKDRTYAMVWSAFKHNWRNK